MSYFIVSDNPNIINHLWKKFNDNFTKKSVNAIPDRDSQATEGLLRVAFEQYFAILINEANEYQNLINAKPEPEIKAVY